MALLSVVVPAFNEQQVLPTFFARLKAALATLPDPAEIVFVNDGSTDATPALLDAWAAEDARVRVLHFTRNFGHQAALTAGIDHARGDAVVLIDADLQDPPELIPVFHARWREGNHVVFGRRRRSNEGALKRIVYHSFYKLLHALADIDIPLDSGDFSLMDRALVDRLRQLPERTRFLRGLRSWVGLRQTAVEYERPARAGGDSKYTLAKLFKLAFDGIVSFSAAPLRLALLAGALVSLAGFVLIGVLLYLRLVHAFDLPGWTSLMVVVLFLGGIQLLTVGIVGEYIARIYEEVKNRPVYLVARSVGGPVEARTPQSLRGVAGGG
jgi:polyisoprenyl-phosphate glycosyltransferase